MAPFGQLSVQQLSQDNRIPSARILGIDVKLSIQQCQQNSGVDSCASN